MLLHEAVDRYLVEVYLPRQPKHDTLVKTKGELKLMAEHFGPDTPVADIDTRAVADWRYALLKGGNGAATVNRRQADLRALLNKVRKWGYEVGQVEFDPIKQPRPKERYLTEEEFKRLRIEAPPHLERLIVFLAGTGARLSEALELTWERVIRDNGRWSVVFDVTKGWKTRSVPLPADVQAMLDAIEPKTGRVFLY